MPERPGLSPFSKNRGKKMKFKEIRHEEDKSTVSYQTVWEYDYPYMLLFLQHMINEDMESGIFEAVTGDEDESEDFMGELSRTGGNLRNCRSLMRPESFIRIGGISDSMKCRIRLVLFRDTNLMQLEVSGDRTIFEEQGDHAFDLYMDSFEIIAYMEAARIDEQEIIREKIRKIQNISKESRNDDEG